MAVHPAVSLIFGRIDHIMLARGLPKGQAVLPGGSGKTRPISGKLEEICETQAVLRTAAPF